MLRFIVVSLVLTFIVRSIARLYGAFMEGLRGSNGDAPRGRRPPAGSSAVQMVRDPVCGTFVVPERAVTIADGRSRVYFCSERCRDMYRARTA